MKDILVLGGGIVGLGTARALARRGVKVALWERGRLGEEATAASAGMLTLIDEPVLDGPLHELGRRAAERYPSLVADLASETGIDVCYERRGMLCVALQPTEEERLAEMEVRAGRQAIRCRKLSGDEARRLEPLLADAVTSALFFPDDAQLEPDPLVRALAASCRNAGVELREETEARSMRPQGSGLRVEGSLGTIDCGKVVVACGAWSSGLGVPPLRPDDVFPSRGQILVFQHAARPGAPIVDRLGHGYVVSRRDGRVVAGSTLEPGLWDKVVTADGVRRLAKNPCALMPKLGLAPLVASWAGLRPASKDGLPILGESALPGVYYAAGHYRNGILLGPETAELLAELVTTGRSAMDLAPFSPARLASTTSSRP